MVSNKCCVRGCSSSKKNGSKLFSVPNGAKNVVRREQWLKKMRLSMTSLVGHKLLICAKHFDKNDFFSAANFQRLKPGAIPHLSLELETPPLVPASELHPQFSTPNPILTQNPLLVPDASIKKDVYVQTETPDILELNTQIEKLKRQVSLLKRENSQLKKTNETVTSGLEKLFNEDQFTCLKNGSMRGSTWSRETLIKAYKIRLTCGSTGYDLFREMGHPLPSQRTLQRRIEHLKFSPGLLNEVLCQLKIKVEVMKDEEKHCSILLDEIAITSKYDYDPSTGLVLGKPTVPSSTGQLEELSTHGLVYMIAGVTTRWKQIVGYQLTGLRTIHITHDLCNPRGTIRMTFLTFLISHKAAIFILVSALYISLFCRMGLKVDVVISDMGGQNQAIWRLFDIHAGRFSKVQNYCVHPCDPSRSLYFHPDPPHVFKNLRGILTNGYEIIIPECILTKFQLPNAAISLLYVRMLLDIDNEMHLKLAPYLKESCLKPSHFEKMSVGLALRLINRDTAAALKYCVQKNKLPEEALVTAWFFETMHEWFNIVTSRSRMTAITKEANNFEKKQNFLQEIVELFYALKIGPKNVWKPVQTGVILASTNAMQLSRYYIQEKGFYYVCLGRFTQDALENLFSMVRYINPAPSPKYLKMALRLICVAQFFKPNKRGNYHIDDSEYLVEFFKDSNISPMENEEDEFYENQTNTTDLELVDELKMDELQSLYYLSGRTVHQFIKMKKIKCTTCLKAIKTKSSDENIAHLKALTEFKAYSSNITFTTSEVVELLRKAEIHIRKYASKLIQGETKFKFVVIQFFKSNVFTLPTCHKIAYELANIYFKSRIYFMLRKENNTLSNLKQGSAKCDSRSMGMRKAVQNIY